MKAFQTISSGRFEASIQIFFFFFFSFFFLEEEEEEEEDHTKKNVLDKHVFLLFQLYVYCCREKEFLSITGKSQIR